MHIKEGDLCYVVNIPGHVPTPGIIDRIVIVVRKAYHGEMFATIDGKIHNYLIIPPATETAWVIRPASNDALPWRSYVGDSPVVGKYAERAIIEPALRPIRYKDGEDEMVTVMKKTPIMSQ